MFVSLGSGSCGRRGEGFDKRGRNRWGPLSWLEMYVGLVSHHRVSIEMYFLQKLEADHPVLHLALHGSISLLTSHPPPFMETGWKYINMPFRSCVLLFTHFVCLGQQIGYGLLFFNFIDWISCLFSCAEWKICCYLCMCERTRFSCNWGIVTLLYM